MIVQLVSGPPSTGRGGRFAIASMHDVAYAGQTSTPFAARRGIVRPDALGQSGAMSGGFSRVVVDGWHYAK